MSWEPVITALEIVLFPGFLFIFCYALFCEWVDRRIFARLQNRYGPLYTGWKGILQPLADFIKLLAKEDITPGAADKAGFTATPILFLTIPMTLMFLVPVIGPRAIAAFEGDLIVAFFMTTLINLMIFIGAWSATNRFTVVGGMRSALQMLSYEIPLGLAALGPAVLAKTLCISDIAQWEVEAWKSFLAHPTPLGVVTAVVLAFGFALFTLGELAELEKIPFDIPEAETEIVAGWHTEYSGKKLALIRLGMDVELIFGASLMTALFLGGPSGPWPIPPAVWFIVKTLLCVVLISTLRALFARFRIDQVVRWMWKYYVPLAVVYMIAIQALAVVI